MFTYFCVFVYVWEGICICVLLNMWYVDATSHVENICGHTPYFLGIYVVPSQLFSSIRMYFSVESCNDSILHATLSAQWGLTHFLKMADSNKDSHGPCLDQTAHNMILFRANITCNYPVTSLVWFYIEGTEEKLWEIFKFRSCKGQHSKLALKKEWVWKNWSQYDIFVML